MVNLVFPLNGLKTNTHNSLGKEGGPQDGDTGVLWEQNNVNSRGTMKYGWNLNGGIQALFELKEVMVREVV